MIRDATRRSDPPRRLPHWAAVHAVVVCVVALYSGCAASSGRDRCINANDCRPGYICDDGLCILGEVLDGSLPDVHQIETDSAVYPDADVLCEPERFPLSEQQDSFVIPENARYMHVKLWGAGGNDEGSCPWAQNGAGVDGGQGGFTEAIFEIRRGTVLAPGTELVVIVGQKGQAGTNSRFGFGVRGGGGLSGVFFGPGPITENDAEKAIAIAGGGGSASVPDCHPGGPGNHPDSGGRSTMAGGPGLDTDQIIGGGAGYEGGPGGDIGLAGKGGKGYVDELLATDLKILYSPQGEGPPPNTSDEDYNGTAGVSEQPGLVVIHFVCQAPGPL